MTAASWLLAPATSRLDPEGLLTGLAEQLAPMELIRISAWLPTKHPELWGSQLIWQRGVGCRTLLRPHDTEQSSAYLKSPGEALHSGKQRFVRCRLDANGSPEFPMLAEVAALGATDYFAHVLANDLDRPQWMAFASGRADGFSEAQLSEIETLVPLLALHAQLAVERIAMRSLLEVYLGNNAAKQVLAGEFRRGTGKPVPSAVWFCDLRGFTQLGDRLPPKELVALLDRYFEAIAGPIEAHGGEILKMIGDAALAVFPADQCAAALTAAEEALTAVEPLGLKIGVGLHRGEVVYGNIGGRRRLDFTVIGSTVNEVCRVEALCKELGAPLLMTQAFVDCLGPNVKTVGLGAHALKGVSAPQPVHTLPRYHREG